MPKVIHSSARSTWRTPPEVGRKLVDLFYCAIDLAATAEDRVLPIWLGPGSPQGEDALTVSWYDVAVRLQVAPIGFLNPPFSLEEIKALKAQLGPHNTPEEQLRLASQISALRIENWALKAYQESLAGFTTIGVFPYSPQTEWFRWYVMGHTYASDSGWWSGHAALDYWRLPHRVSFLTPEGLTAANAGVNSCVIQWGPNPGFVGPWVPSGRYWSYR